jgi:hypothetical protein
MRALVVLVLALAACDPIWNVNVRLRDPANLPVTNATVAVACDGDSVWEGFVRRSNAVGVADVGSLGNRFPIGCDVYVAKPGYATHRIRYRDLCPAGSDGCERVFAFDLVMVPEH